MAYRPPRRLAGSRGTSVRRQRSSAGRIAIARATGRRTPGGSPAGMIAAFIALGLVVITATSIVGAGIGVQATLADMEKGLPDVQEFESLKYAQPTRVFDRTGKIQLANFQQERRRVVAFDELPHLVLDATVVTEDKTFWTNPGYDAQAIVRSAFRCLTGDCSSGASTITQQFVRARLLPPALLAPGADDKVRKVKEILQSAHLTDYVTKTYGEQAGKERIITAYLNQIFYGHNAYGIAGAASAYFGKTLDQLSPAEAATLAAIPKSPVCYDLYNWLPKDETGAVVKDAQGRLAIPAQGATAPAGCEEGPNGSGTTNIITRRNSILDDLAAGSDTKTGGNFGRWTGLTSAEVQAAKKEPIVLFGDQPTVFLAPHFVWAMKAQLDQILSDREPAESGGYTVTTTLDMPAQTLAERYVTAGTIVPQLKGTAFDRAIKQFKLQKDKDWIRVLRNRGIFNGALVAMDYSTGDVLAYVGSAGYYQDALASPEFNPKYDVAGVGFRQPGSAFKPVVYTTGFDQRKVTPGSVLLDVTTAFARAWTPKDADQLERGPVLARKALQYSLNIPAIRALDRVGPAVVDQAAAKANLKFAPGTSIALAGLAGAIGTVEVHLKDLVAVYGAFGNAGVVTEPRLITDVKDSSGQSIYVAGDPIGHKVWSAQAAWLMANILEGNTNPRDNSIWGPRFRLDNGPNGQYRPAGLKTGTTNDVRDLSAYGFLAKPKDSSQPAIALGVWMGNSNHAPPTLGNALVFASDGPGEVWHAFMREYMKGKPVTDFERPKGLVQSTIDAYTGGSPGPWTRQTTSEWFINGTQPGGSDAIDPSGVLYSNMCGQWMVDPTNAENKGAPSSWLAADRNWAQRAARGPGVAGSDGTRTAYFWGRSSWGGAVTDGTSCALPTPSLLPTPTINNALPPIQTPVPRPTPNRTPRPRPTATPGPRPTATPGPRPTATPSPRPTATPRPRPTATPAPPQPTPVPTCRNPTHPHGCQGGNDQPTPTPGTSPAPAKPGEASPGAVAQNEVFGLVAVGMAATAPTQHQELPNGITGALMPAIVSDPVATSPVRIGRRRRSNSPRH